MSSEFLKKRVILVLLLFCTFSALVFGLNKKDDENKKLREEILVVYQSKGEQGLRDFFKEKGKDITCKFIVDFAEAGLKERKEKWLKACEVIAVEGRNEKTLADVFFNMGKYFRLNTNFPSSVNYLDKAFQIYEVIDDITGLGNVCLERGAILSDTGELDRVFEIYDKALAFFLKANDIKGQGRVYLRKAVVYSLKSEREKAIAILDKSIPLLEKANDLENLGNAFRIKGDVQLYTGNRKDALETYEKALYIFEQVKDTLGLANTYRSIGDIYYYIGNKKRALDMFDKAVPLFEKINNPGGLGNIYLKKGIIFLNAENRVEALELYDKALSCFIESQNPRGQGNVYQIKADAYLQSGDYSKAQELYEKALSLFEKSGDLLGLGNIYFRKGDMLSIIGDNNRAIEMINKAQDYYQKAGATANQGYVYQRMGALYIEIGDYSKAEEILDKALLLFKKVEDIQGEGNVLFCKGEIYFLIGENSRAIDIYDKAFVLYTKVEDELGQGKVCYRRGDIYQRKGDNASAFEMLDKALVLFNKIGYLHGQGDVYMRKGGIYLRVGEYSKAEKMFDKALLFSEKVIDSELLGEVYKCKGELFFYTGNNSKALEMYNKAIKFFEKTGYPSGIGDIYYNKGKIYSLTGMKSKAIEMYEKALNFYEKTENPIAQGNVYIQKGDIYLHSNYPELAIQMFDKALELFKKAGSVDGQGNAFGSKGSYYLFIGNKSRALEVNEKALVFHLKAENLMGQANVYWIKGDIYLKNGANRRALQMYDKALKYLRMFGDIESISYVLDKKAKILVKLGKKDDACNFFEEGIAILEKVRRQTAFLEMKRTFLEGVYPQYEETALYLLENKQYEKGFKCAESMKARAFLDQMSEGLISLEKGLKPELKEERDRLVGKLSALSRQKQEIPGKDEKKLQELKDEYRRVESQFDDLLIKIRLDNPLYASVNYPQPLSVHDLQKDILKEGETLLSYFISQDESYAFVISKNNFNVEPLKIKEKEVNGLAERYFLAIKENNANNMNRFGSLLYEKLFMPLEKYLVKSSDIIIVPAGQLETIPFESFIINDRKPGPPVYLLEKYRLKHVQSATLLSILRKNYNGDSAAKGFIGFGDPVYDYENFKQRKPEQGSMNIFATKAPSHQKFFNNNIFGVPLCLGAFVAISTAEGIEEGDENEIKGIFRDRYARAGGIMDRLPQSGEEIQTIARLFDKESLATKVYLREQASEENARVDNMKDYAYIHFSCHGLLNDDFQCLVLSQLPETKEDGYFTLNEIMNCNYNAKLIVLSACRTGSGKMARGEGITGLTRAFMYAGSPAVVASLWDVDDTATKELMVKFYSNMLEKNLDKVEALRQAKLELLKDEKYFSPLFWSAFVMYGE